MNDTTQICVAVTRALTEALIRAEKLASQPEDFAKSLNDNKDFRDIVATIETLVIRTMAARSAVSMFHPVTTGPRFKMGRNSSVARYVDEATEYLQTKAAPLLANGKLSRYHGDNAKEALLVVRDLYGSLMTAIESSVYLDVQASRVSGPADLVALAQTMSRLASQAEALPGDEG